MSGRSRPEDWRNVFDEDLRAAGFGPLTPSLRLLHPEIWFVRCLRRFEAADRAPASPLRPIRRRLAQFEHAVLGALLGFTIPPHVFGPGLSIAHVGTIVVNGDARVGPRCRLHPGVTIGSVRGLAPVLGAEVFLAPGAGVYGDVVVGDRVHIGPNAVVTESVPDDTLVVAGRPTLRPRRRPTWWRENRAHGGDGA